LAGVPHGAEWSASRPSDVWMQGFAWAGALLVGGPWAALRARREGRLRWETILLCAGALAGILLSIKSVRFVELSMPLATLAGGLLLRDAFGGRSLPRPAFLGAAAAVALALVATSGRATQNGDLDPHRYAPAGDWMRENLEPGTLVHNFRWGDWSELVFHAPEQQYIFGLEPAFLAGKDRSLWDHFWAIRTGEYGNVGAAVKGEFGAEWVFTGLPEPGVLQLFDADATLERALVTPDFAIYRVVAP